MFGFRLNRFRIEFRIIEMEIEIESENQIRIGIFKELRINSHRTQLNRTTKEREQKN